MKVSIASINVGERRREDKGNIEELASSIKKYGLLHPIVIDEDGHLVAGERRLLACKSLGWSEVEVQSLGELSETELREIELEENLRRKDLTAYERSRTLVQYVETVKEAAKQELRTLCVRNPEPGRPHEPGSYRDISERIDIPVATIQKAEQHVSAIDRYPIIKTIPGVPQSNAITIAKNLDALPEEVREEKIEALRQYDLDTLAELAEVPPMPKGPSPEEQARKSAGHQWLQALMKINIFLRGVKDGGGIEKLLPRWPDKESKLEIAGEMESIATQLHGWAQMIRKATQE